LANVESLIIGGEAHVVTDIAFCNIDDFEFQPSLRKNCLSGLVRQVQADGGVLGRLRSPQSAGGQPELRRDRRPAWTFVLAMQSQLSCVLRFDQTKRPGAFSALPGGLQRPNECLYGGGLL
jgi:hypothetical protein